MLHVDGMQPSSGALYVKSRVAMDFSGDQGRVVADPSEALGVAFEEGYNWRVSLTYLNLLLCGKSIAELLYITCHMGSHSDIRHPTLCRSATMPT